MNVMNNLINFNKPCLQGCSPTQIVNFNIPIDFENLNCISVYNDEGCLYDFEDMQFAYSIDMSCWSCYSSYKDLLINTVDLNSDFYIRFKVKGPIGKIIFKCEEFKNYSVTLDSNFAFSYCSSQNTNLYNPYLNMDNAISLQQNLAETVSCIVGIPCYYFKLSPNKGSKDITFKEYALLDVEAVKQIKIIIADNQMPSSKPEFSDFGLDWETDWETEITKGSFATAFGNNVMPMEGDLVYIPMMKRMWMVSSAYEEKRDAFMWNSTTFKVMLVKYQEKDSVNLGDSEELVQSFVKNKYEDLFGTDENNGSSESSVSSPVYAADNLYPIYESDAIRKYVSCSGVSFQDLSTYYKGTLISDRVYLFNPMLDKCIQYQQQYCGESGVVSFIINPQTIDENRINSFKVLSVEEIDEYITTEKNVNILLKQDGVFENNLISIANIKLNISQSLGTTTSQGTTKLTLINSKNINITIENGKTYFVFLRWNKSLNLIQLSAAEYKHIENIPIYKLGNSHYYYDIDNMITSSGKYNMEMVQLDKGDIIINNFSGTLTNIKIFNKDNDNISELLQMYPTNSNLLLNDTARPIFGLPGYAIK